jgi:hypothetical protein
MLVKEDGPRKARADAWVERLSAEIANAILITFMLNLRSWRVQPASTAFLLSSCYHQNGIIKFTTIDIALAAGAANTRDTRLRPSIG